MSVGRRDYTWGFLNESATEGRYTESLEGYFYMGIQPVTTGVVFSYTVPAGFRAGLSTVAISCSSGLDCIIYIKKGNDLKAGGYFTGLRYFNFPDKTTMYFNEGEVINVAVYNAESVANIFFGWVSAVLEALAP